MSTFPVPRTNKNLPLLLGESAAIVSLRREIEAAARTDAKVLVLGETGSGKEVVARLIHEQSARASRTFVAVNCSGIPETLPESELFGHTRGSFTGAYRDKPGLVRQADRGTLFLDELGEMTPRMQGMLLRFLENGEIQAVGADVAATRVNVRVIAATNRNLSEMVAAGTFREDLLYRLRVVHLHVPPLRERPEDVRPLGAHFLDKLPRPIQLADDAWAALEKYQWPGNVRELQNIIEQVFWLTPLGEPVTAAHLPPLVAGGGTTLTPTRERRRRLSDELFRMITQEGHTFWEPIQRMFLARDLTRRDVRELVQRGLRETRGSYRAVVTLFNLPESDYKKFMNFLCTHGCRPEFRDFRNTVTAPEPNRPPLVPEFAVRERQAAGLPANHSERAA